jgi:hypothetical protein
MIAAIGLVLCCLAAYLQFGGRKKESLDRGEVRRINRHFDKLHPEDGSPLD